MSALYPRSVAQAAQGFENILFKFGRGTIGTTRSLLWDGAAGDYTGWYSTAVQLSAVSDDTDDDVGQPGAQTLVIIGQDANGLELTDEIELDGTTPVDLNELFSIVYRAYIKETNDDSEVTGPNHGTISIYEKATPANICAHINPTMGKTLMCLYRVPRNKFGKLTHVNAFPAATANTRSTIMAFTRNIFGLGVGGNGAWNVQGSAEAGPDSGHIEVELHGAPRFLAPGTDIVLTGQINTGTGIISANFTIELEEL